jgi:glutaredoxin
MYYLFFVVLENCPFSEAVVDLCNKHKIDYKSLIISRNEKDKYKTDEINTFPQVYLKKTRTNDSLLLGGFTDFELFFNTFANKKYNLNNVNIFTKKYPMWNKRAILRLIELINKKNLIN